MVMLNDSDRFHLVMGLVDRVDQLGTRAAVLRQRMADARLAARRYTREHGEDDPQIAGLVLGSRVSGTSGATDGNETTIGLGVDDARLR